MTEIRLLLDENVDPLYRAELLKREPALVVWIVGDPGAPAKGTPDTEILRWCEDQAFLLVTNNRKTMPRHLKEHLANGSHVPGIIELGADISFSETVDELLLICLASQLDDHQDLIIYVPL
jgi:hypothetical protein